MMLNVMICDDVPEEAEFLRKQLADLLSGKAHRVLTFGSGECLLEYLEKQRPEASVFFLDIQLGQGKNDGIWLAERILDANPQNQIIFVSGYDDYYEEVYTVDHLYFVKKPVTRQKLQKTMKRAVERLGQIIGKCLCVQTKNGTYVAPLAEICYLEKDKRKIYIQTTDGQMCSFYGRFADIMEKLSPDFIQCHNSYVINMAWVRSLNKSCFLMYEGREIPISRTYCKAAKEAFLEYVQEHYD